LHFNIKINLFSQCTFHWILTDRNFKRVWNQWEHFWKEEQQVYITLNMLIDSWMTNFDSHFAPMIFCFVYLTYWSTCHWLRIKLFKNLFNLFSVVFFEVSSSFTIRMLWGILSQMNEFVCHFRANDISSMTQILEGFNPYNSCSLYCWDK